MKYILYLLILICLQLGVGIIDTTFLFYIPVFQLVVLFYSLIWLKKDWKLNKYFKYFSYSIFLLIFSFFIDFAFVIYWLIIFTPITIYLAHIFYYKKNGLLRILIILAIPMTNYFGIKYIVENVEAYFHYESDFQKDLIIPFSNIDGQPYQFEEDKIYVLDFWNTSCGICIQKFPFFSDMSNKYADNDKIEFYAVNIQQKGDTKEKVLKYVTNKGYHFNNLMVENKEEAKKIDVVAVPTVLIVKNNKIVYNGFPSYEDHLKFNRLDDLIEKFLE
ncbi:TlpA family protein disulfide reductase [Capnocytophaga sp. ARDL2]|uniref:TlpA family protein disulfide reductase n=1 Tax=Capnocytophaga sp. ARDL2 TaxID=3238809 RepID=UPI0035573E0D